MTKTIIKKKKKELLKIYLETISFEQYFSCFNKNSNILCNLHNYNIVLIIIEK